MIRLGILGTASIVRPFLGPELQGVQIVAVASRERERAERFGETHSIPLCFGSYQALLDCAEVDAVYVPLPHHLHCEWVIRAAQAGKHVLVEKPAATSAGEIERMLAACRSASVVCMEALMYRHKAIHARVKHLVDSGELGALRYVDFSWCFNIRRLARSSFRLDPSSGGGPLLDVGVYGVDFLRHLTGMEPELLHATLRREKTGGVEMFAHALLRLGPTTAALACGYDTDANYYMVSGELGSAFVSGSVSGRQVENVLALHFLDGDKRREERFPAENPYPKELEYFAHCIERHERPATGLENSLRNLAVLDRIRATAAELPLRPKPGDADLG
jgi:D-xylose 1-dehydrogenase (NADP+, D-xylono-1,5-lactone-forming)